jgi:hypothetical protein
MTRDSSSLAHMICQASHTRCCNGASYLALNNCISLVTVTVTVIDKAFADEFTDPSRQYITESTTHRTHGARRTKQQKMNKTTH